MAEYLIRTGVFFDPCALDSHEWHPCKFGLAEAVGADECSKCGETRIREYASVGDIDRSENEIWTAFIDWESKLQARFPDGVTQTQTPFMALIKSK